MTSISPAMPRRTSSRPVPPLLWVPSSMVDVGGGVILGVGRGVTTGAGMLTTASSVAVTVDSTSKTGWAVTVAMLVRVIPVPVTGIEAVQVIWAPAARVVAGQTTLTSSAVLAGVALSSTRARFLRSAVPVFVTT